MTQAGWVDHGNGRHSFRPAGSLNIPRPTPTTIPRPAPDAATVTTVEGHDVPSPHDESVNGLLRRLIFLNTQLKTTEGSVKTLKAEIREVDEKIREHWAEENINQAGIEGKIAYLYPVYHVEKVDGASTDDIRQALRDAGLDYMMSENYSASSLTAYLKELRQAGDEPPAPLAAVVKLVPSSVIRLKEASARTAPIAY